MQKNNKLVWNETVRIMEELFDNVWGPKDTVEIENITDLTVPVRPSSGVLSASRFHSSTLCSLWRAGYCRLHFL